jgi:signal transduction histidine kinase
MGSNMNSSTPNGSDEVRGNVTPYEVELQKKEVLLEILPILFHKLKNKLTPILGFSQILLAKSLDESSRDRLSKIERSATELNELMDTLMGYFDDNECVKKRHSLNTILSDIETQLKSNISESENIHVHIETGDGLPTDDLNYGQIACLITHLADNALKALRAKTQSNAQKEMSIITRMKGDHYALIVEDNGVGIDEEEISKIWLPFYSGFQKGTGIGLCICERILHNHQADVEVISEKGSGTRFEITFYPNRDER